MATLGEILALLHEATDRARPARLTVIEWRHGPRSEEAFRRFMALRHPGSAAMMSVGGGHGGVPEESSWTTTLSFEAQTRFREEAAGVQAGKRYLVRDGDRWASWDADWGAQTSETAEEQGARSATYGLLLDPNPLLGVLRLGSASPTEVAGRAAWQVTAVPRDEETGTGALFRVGPGADTIELAIDAERGALLRSEAFLAGEPFHRLEVTEIAYGPLPADALELALPEGVEPAASAFAPLRLELHELPARTPFPVFVPARVPDGWRLQESLLVPGRVTPPVEAEVSLVYGSRGGGYAVTVRERSATAERDDWLTWEESVGLEVADAGEHVEPRHYVRVERDGTVIELAGGDPILLAELAGELIPAPTEPPRLGNG
jgi:hypothetical protein